MTFVELPELMTVAEVQSYLRIGKNAAYELVASGRLPAINLGKRQLRIPRHALAELIGVPTGSAPEEPLKVAAA